MNNVQAWHALFDSENINELEKLLDKNAVFLSPVVFKPQEGRKITAIYLKSAYNMFFADGNDSFKYIRELNTDTDSVLEFTCEVDGVIINGVDMIRWNEEGKIQEFKVMVRPNKAIEMVKEKMGELLANLSTMDKLKMKAGVMIDKIKK